MAEEGWRRAGRWGGSGSLRSLPDVLTPCPRVSPSPFLLWARVPARRGRKGRKRLGDHPLSHRPPWSRLCRPSTNHQPLPAIARGATAGLSPSAAVAEGRNPLLASAVVA